jgi:hypothetical protein
MKTDRYTKTLLTVIAICLVILVFKGTGMIQSTNANEAARSNRNNINFGMIPINSDGSINVHIKSDSAEKDIIDVNIESCSTTAFMMAEPISVKIYD